MTGGDSFQGFGAREPDDRDPRDIRGLNQPPFREFDSAFATMPKNRIEAVVVTEDGEFAQSFGAIAVLAAKNKLPSIGSQEYAQAGGLIGYGANLFALYRRAAYFVDRIIKGTKPADLPIEQPTRFELVINLKTAKALGLTVPPTLLARADEVIE